MPSRLPTDHPRSRGEDYPRTSGTVTWDGTDPTAADPDELLSRVAMLPQDIARWQATLRENITLGQGDQGDRAVLAAARAVGATEVIDSLTDGLETHIRPFQSGGRDLSGGSGSGSPPPAPTPATRHY